MERMFALPVAFLVIFFSTVNGGYLNGNCVLTYPNGKDVEYTEWVYDLFLHPAIPDTAQPGDEVAHFKVKNIAMITGRQSRYLVPKLGSGTLRLILNDAFKFFEEIEMEPDIKMDLDFQCTEGSARIAMWAVVEDSNNHAPRLGGTPYTFKLPLPFPPAVPLTCVTSGVVSAEDIDLSNTLVAFQLEGTDRLAVTRQWQVGRVFYAEISTTLYIYEPLTATLRATDNGEPPLSTEAVLKVVADEKLSLPAFTSSSKALPPTQDHKSSKKEAPKILQLNTE